MSDWVARCRAMWDAKTSRVNRVVDPATALAMWEAAELGLDRFMLSATFHYDTQVVDRVLASVERVLVGAGEITVNAGDFGDRVY